MEQEPGQDPEHDGPAGPQPGEGSPEPDDNDESVFGPWDGLEGTLGAAKEREELLSAFAPGGTWDGRPPGPELAAAVAKAAGPQWRCGLATGPELIGLLRAMAALQSWAGAGLLGMIRALIRDDDPSFLGRARHGDLPDEWDDSLVHEIALALAVSAPSAEKTTRAAWELGARLPGRRAAAPRGDPGPAAGAAGRRGLRGSVRRERAKAEELLLPRADRAAAQDLHPDRADRHRDRRGGRPGPGRAAAEGGREAPLTGDDVPRAGPVPRPCRAGTCRPTRPWPRSPTSTARAAAVQGLRRVPGRADRPAAGDGVPRPPQRHLRRRPDRLRPSQPRRRPGRRGPGESRRPPRIGPADTEPGATPAGQRGPAGEPGLGGSDCPCDECDGRCAPPDDDLPDGRTRRRRARRPGGPGDGGDGGPRGGGEPPATSGPGGEAKHGPGDDDGPRPSTAPPAPRPTIPGPDDAKPALTDLVLPLATLLGLADRPGEGHGLGTLDPALCRTLAATAARSPHTTICVTVTNHDGIAIGHGCAKPGRPAPAARRPRPAPGRAPRPDQPHHHRDPPGPTTRPAGSRHPDTQQPARPDHRATTATRAAGDRLGARPPRRQRPPATPTGAAPGRSPCPAAWSSTSTSSPCPRLTATTATSPTPTSPTPPSATSSRSATTPARSRPATATPAKRLRARRPVRPGRRHVRLQRGSKKPQMPPGQAVTRLERHPAQTRLAPVDHPPRPHLHPRPQALPRLSERKRGSLPIPAVIVMLVACTPVPASWSCSTCT